MPEFALSTVGPLVRAPPRPQEMPSNTEAEQALLGALLVDNRAFERVSEFLKAEHFYAPAHGRIYAAIAKLVERGQAASAVTLKNAFDSDEDLTHLGGAAYLAELTAGVITIVNAHDYARTILEMHRRRQLYEIGDSLKASALTIGVDDDSQKILEAVEQQLYLLAEEKQTDKGAQSLGFVLRDVLGAAESAYRHDGKFTLGLSTEFVDLDRKLGGLMPGDLIILAGRPSMGKTALATNIGFKAAQTHAETRGEAGGVVAFFSLEMTAQQVGHRIACGSAGINSNRVRRGELSSGEFRTFVEAQMPLSNVPFYIDDTSALSISQLRARARRIKRKNGLGLIIVDYLQLLRGTGSRQSTDNRVLEISEITRGLKAIAKELSVPVLALSQLSRAVEQREDKRPLLSDLRESGSIEQDADVVGFIYRDEYYAERDEPKQGPKEKTEQFADRMAIWTERMKDARGMAEVIIGKQRSGPTGTVRLCFDGATTSFSNLATAHYDQDRIL